VAHVTDRSITYNIDMGAMGQLKKIVEVRPSAGASAGERRMEADLGHNPIVRVFGCAVLSCCYASLSCA